MWAELWVEIWELVILNLQAVTGNTGQEAQSVTEQYTPCRDSNNPGKLVYEGWENQEGNCHTAQRQHTVREQCTTRRQHVARAQCTTQ